MKNMASNKLKLQFSFFVAFVFVSKTNVRCNENIRPSNNFTANTDDVWRRILEVNSKVVNQTLSDDDGPFSTGVRYTLVEGDIRRYEDDEPQRSPKKKTFSPPFSWHRRLWSRVIPYEVHPSLRSITGMIEKELRYFEKKTCLRFKRRTRSDKRWILYRDGNDCSSGLGRSMHHKGAHGISLAPLCRHPGTISHETLHALGIWHEQSRSDRDSFVKLFKNNIRKSALSQFWKQEYSLLNTPYDYSSVMHYSNRAFVKLNVRGNALQHKFDPNFKLGGQIVTEHDIADVNLMYQCDVKSGWSRWSGYSPCIKNYWKECLKANVRFCTSLDWKECPYHTKHGVQEHVVECDKKECDFLKINGIWGKWGPFSTCSASCGWGSHTRYRKCNNPTPRNGGKQCPGPAKEEKLCRRKRCGPAHAADIDFEIGKKGWTFKNYRIVSGKANQENSGPLKDHTSTLTNTWSGNYALASKLKSSFIKKVATLKSPWISTLLNFEKCVVFHYMLNGKTLHNQALAMFAEYRNGRRINLPFLAGGHKGNYWKRAAVKIPPMRTTFRFVFESRFHAYLFADVAIDDVFLDHKPCLKGLQGCGDYNNNCPHWAKENRCKKKNEMEFMLSTCCASCSNPNKCTNNDKSCLAWAQSGWCKKNPGYMLKECCLACKNPSKTCTDTHESCSKWAGNGECKKNPNYMLINCCKSCKEVPAKKCFNKAEKNLCGARGRTGDCTIGKYKQWMVDNCCQTCFLLRNPKLCTGTTYHGPKCLNWAKEGECRKNPWVIDNCCQACKKHSK